jgi:hypothetical protein
VQVVDIEFGKYLRFYSYEDLIVCTDDGKANKLIVLLKNSPQVKTKLGYQWKEICMRNNFGVGNIIRFKFGTYNRCHLFKIN